MRVVDIAAIAKKAKAAGAAVAVDNTFLSPALQQPIALGADFVIHSTTKYLNGHSDIVGGAVIAAEAEDAAALAAWANTTGVTGSPFDAYQTLRGVRTLFPRVESQQRNAGAVAAFLEAHPQVRAVHYPGLSSHPGHAIAKKQQRGFGAMLSFELRGGVEEVRRFVNTVRIFTLADLLGGIESIVAHPATMTHASMDPQARHTAGITDTLLRLSVGLESEGDLIEDLAQALKFAGNWSGDLGTMKHDAGKSGSLAEFFLLNSSLLNGILQSSSEAIMASDVKKGRILFWNPGATRIFGFDATEALGQSLDLIIPEKLRARHWQGYRHVMETGQSRYSEGDLLSVPALTKDGRRISVEFTIAILRDDHGNMIGMASVMRDSTARFDEMKSLRRGRTEWENTAPAP